MRPGQGLAPCHCSCDLVSDSLSTWALGDTGSCVGVCGGVGGALGGCQEASSGLGGSAGHPRPLALDSKHGGREGRRGLSGSFLLTPGPRMCFSAPRPHTQREAQRQGRMAGLPHRVGKWTFLGLPSDLCPRSPCNSPQEPEVGEEPERGPLFIVPPSSSQGATFSSRWSPSILSFFPLGAASCHEVQGSRTH